MALAFLATLKIDGFEEPSARGGIAVLIDVIPAWIASRQQREPSPVVQCVCNSAMVSFAFWRTDRARVRVRSGVRIPPGSFKHTLNTFSFSASLVFCA